jgi:hypothetical protein
MHAVVHLSIIAPTTNTCGTQNSPLPSQNVTIQLYSLIVHALGGGIQEKQIVWKTMGNQYLIPHYKRREGEVRRKTQKKKKVANKKEKETGKLERAKLQN